MAWSRARPRTGASRREARQRLTATLVGVGVVLTGLVLLIMHRVAPDRFAALNGLALDAVAPFWEATHGPVDALSEAGDRIDDYFAAVSRVEALEAENRRLQQEAARSAALAGENLRLKRLFRLSEPGRTRIAVARIAGGAGASPTETAIISAGARDGVKVGQPAFTDDGILGRVVDVGGRAARILLVTDSSSRIPVRVARTGASGLLEGTGTGQAVIAFASPAELRQALRVGDRLISSGEGGIYPPEVPVAQVTALEADRALARPVARPATLGFVVIEDIWLPPPPAAASAGPPPAGSAAGVPAPTAGGQPVAGAAAKARAEVELLKTPVTTAAPPPKSTTQP